MNSSPKTVAAAASVHRNRRIVAHSNDAMLPISAGIVNDGSGFVVVPLGGSGSGAGGVLPTIIGGRTVGGGSDELSIASPLALRPSPNPAPSAVAGELLDEPQLMLPAPAISAATTAHSPPHCRRRPLPSAEALAALGQRSAEALLRRYFAQKNWYRLAALNALRLDAEFDLLYDYYSLFSRGAYAKQGYVLTATHSGLSNRHISGGATEGSPLSPLADDTKAGAVAHRLVPPLQLHLRAQFRRSMSSYKSTTAGGGSAYSFGDGGGDRDGEGDSSSYSHFHSSPDNKYNNSAVRNSNNVPPYSFTIHGRAETISSSGEGVGSGGNPLPSAPVNNTISGIRCFTSASVVTSSASAGQSAHLGIRPAHSVQSTSSGYFTTTPPPHVNNSYGHVVANGGGGGVGAVARLRGRLASAASVDMVEGDGTSGGGAPVAASDVFLRAGGGPHFVGSDGGSNSSPLHMGGGVGGGALGPPHRYSFGGALVASTSAGGGSVSSSGGGTSSDGARVLASVNDSRLMLMLSSHANEGGGGGGGGHMGGHFFDHHTAPTDSDAADGGSRL